MVEVGKNTTCIRGVIREEVLRSSVIQFTPLNWAWGDRCPWRRKSWLLEDRAEREEDVEVWWGGEGGGGRIGNRVCCGVL